MYLLSVACRGNKMVQLRIVGLIQDPLFHKSKLNTETLKERHPAVIASLQIEAHFEFQW